MVLDLVRICVENEAFGECFCMDCPANLHVGCGVHECPADRDMTESACVRRGIWLDMEVGLRSLEREIEEGLSACSPARGR